jgi:arylsulfatase A
MIRNIQLLTCLSVAAMTGVLPAAAATSAKPNVIFILADDLGYGDLGCYGQKHIQTPNIDRLAAEGTRFTQAYSGATVCAPSRCALMTGKHGGHAFIRGNKELPGEGQTPMPPDTFTVARLMKKAGYQTGLIGKWGLGHPDSNSTPNNMGFDYFFGYNCQRQAHEYYPPHLWRNTQKVMLEGKSYSHDLMAEEALEFVRRYKDQPFFLYLAFTIPHAKMQVPEIGAYEKEAWPENLKKMAAMISRMDRDIGRLMALLKELGLDTNTLVTFASDNGPHAEGGIERKNLFQSAGPLRGIKRDLYEGGIRVPMIARWPGRVKASVVSDQVWAFWDYLPTMAELTGQKPPTGLDGISILPALLEGKAIEHPPLYFEFHERGFTQAARMGDWKVVRLAPSQPLELFNLKTDLAETRNVAAQHPDVVKRFEDYLKTARVESELWPVRENAARKGGGEGKNRGKDT